MIRSILLVAAAALMVLPKTVLMGQLLLLLSIPLLIPGTNQHEVTRALLAGTLGAVVVIASATSALMEGLSIRDTGLTIRYVLIPAAWMLVVVLGWRRFQTGLWAAAAVNGLGHIAVAVQTVRLSPVYWEPDLGWIGSSRIFVKLFDPPNLVYAPSLSSAAFGAAIAGAGYFLTRSVWRKAACLVCTAAFLALAVWLGNKAATYAVGGTWLIAYLVASKGTGRLIAKLAMIVIATTLAWAIFEERFADEGRQARISDEFDPTFTGRTDIWRDNLQDVARYPLGVTLERARDEIGFSEHSTPLQAVRVFGWIPGGIILCGYALLAMTVISLWFRRSRDTLPFLIAGAGACVAMSLIESMMIGSSGGMYALTGMIGWVMARPTPQPARAPAHRRYARWQPTPA